MRTGSALHLLRRGRFRQRHPLSCCLQEPRRGLHQVSPEPKTFELLDVTILEPSAANLKPYGSLFSDYDSEPVPIERWPQPGWRAVEDGISGGVTEGDFILSWENGRHFARNTGVADGEYCFAWTSPTEAIKAASSFGHASQAYEESKNDEHVSELNSEGQALEKHEVGGSAHLFFEINYHACGSQLFYSGMAPFYLLVAKPPSERFPDDVIPSDFVAFRIPAGTGVSVNSFVWHSPPIASLDLDSDRQDGVRMKTKQARFHSKIYYNPLEEHNTLLRINVAG